MNPAGVLFFGVLLFAGLSSYLTCKAIEHHNGDDGIAIAAIMAWGATLILLVASSGVSYQLYLNTN